MAADMLARAFVEIRAMSQNLRGDLRNAEGVVKNSAQNMQDVLGGLIVGLGGIAGGGALLGFGLNFAAEMERSEVAFNVIIKDMEKTRALLLQLKEFSVTTPFTPREVQKSAQAMLAFRHSVEDLPKFLQMLGDASAGSGAELGELTRIFNKIKSTGRLTGETFEQFAERGVNIRAELAEMLGKTGDEMVEMQRRGEISFDLVVQAFEKMTSEGGMFFQAMKKQSTTFFGLVSTMQGIIETLAQAIGDELLGGAKLLLQQAINLGNAMMGLNEATGGYIAKATAATSATLVLASALVTLKMAGLDLSKAFKLAMIGTGAGAVLVLIGSIIAGVVQLTQWIAESESFTESWAKASETLVQVWDRLLKLGAVLWEKISAAAGGALDAIGDMFGVSFGTMQEDLGGFFGAAVEGFANFALDAVEWVQVLVENSNAGWEILKQGLLVALSFWADQWVHSFELVPQLAGLMVRNVVILLIELVDQGIGLIGNFVASVSELVGKIPELIAAAMNGQDLGSLLAAELEAAFSLATAPARGFIKGLQGEIPSLIATPSNRTKRQIDALRGMFAELEGKKKELERGRFRADAGDAKKQAKGIGKEVGEAAAKGISLKLPQFVGFEDLQKQFQGAITKAETPEKKTAENTGKLVGLAERGNQIQEKILEKAGDKPANAKD